MINNPITINVRRYTVLARDNRTGAEESVTVTVTKQQLQAAGFIGQSSKELIERICTRQGYTVLDIGTPDKLAVTVDLDELCGGQADKREGMEEISRDALEFLLACVQDLASCLEQDAEDHFDDSRCGAGEFIRDDIQISGNLLNRADELRCYVQELAEKHNMEMDDGQQ